MVFIKGFIWEFFHCERPEVLAHVIKERQGKWSCCFFPEIGEGQEVSAVEQVSPVPVFFLTIPRAKKSIEQQGN